MTWQRIGIALTKPEGPTSRRREYEIIVDPMFSEHRHARYVGYREWRPDGEACVGLPLSGPSAYWAQPIIDFHATDYHEVRWFERKDRVTDV